MKRGGSLYQSINTYSHLGIKNVDISGMGNDEKDQSSDLPKSSVGAGGLLKQILNRLKMVATKIMQLLINAMKVIPKFVGIKPSIGFSGPFPMISFQLDLQTESLNLYDLFQDLTKGL